MIGPPLTASKQRTFSVEGIGPLPRSIVDTTRGDHDDLSREDVRLGCLGHGVLLEAVMFRKKHGHGRCRADEFHKCRVKLRSPKVGRNDDAWAFCTDWLCAWASCTGGRSTRELCVGGRSSRALCDRRTLFRNFCVRISARASWMGKTCRCFCMSRCGTEAFSATCAGAFCVACAGAP